MRCCPNLPFSVLIRSAGYPKLGLATICGIGTVTSPSRLQSMGTVYLNDPQELRKLATELRDDALQADLPGYAAKMIHAAEDLEKRAAELEALR